uniref:PVR related immunoglobulin domain containing n=1 Tax=Catagonus wagneri TaxID=51154 RepID=A0A8C3WU58_9CETA
GRTSSQLPLQCLSPPPPHPSSGLPWALVLCLYPPETPKVWVQVQMEATESLSFTVRCGFLGSGSISLVTVSYGGPEGAGGTTLAVLHPKFGTQHWVPACQAHWDTRSSISLTLEGSEGRNFRPNATFCCKFTSFPEGSQEACGNLSLSTDEGLAAPTPAPVLRADLVGILGVSGVFFFGSIYLLCLLHRQRHCLSHPDTTAPRHRAGQASAASLHTPYATVNTSYLCPTTQHSVFAPRPPPKWATLPTHAARGPQSLAPWTPPARSARSSFISVENRLYAQAGTGTRPLHARPAPSPLPDPLGHRPTKEDLGAR